MNDRRKPSKTFTRPSKQDKPAETDPTGFAAAPDDSEASSTASTLASRSGGPKILLLLTLVIAIVGGGLALAVFVFDLGIGSDKPDAADTVRVTLTGAVSDARNIRVEYRLAEQWSPGTPLNENRDAWSLPVGHTQIRVVADNAIGERLDLQAGAHACELTLRRLVNGRVVLTNSTGSALPYAGLQVKQRSALGDESRWVLPTGMNVLEESERTLRADVNGEAFLRGLLPDSEYLLTYHLTGAGYVEKSLMVKGDTDFWTFACEHECFVAGEVKVLREKMPAKPDVDVQLVAGGYHTTVASAIGTARRNANTAQMEIHDDGTFLIRVNRFPTIEVEGFATIGGNRYSGLQRFDFRNQSVVLLSEPILLQPNRSVRARITRSGQPVVAATVRISLHGQTLVAQSNEQGELLFERIKPGVLDSLPTQIAADCILLGEASQRLDISGAFRLAVSGESELPLELPAAQAVDVEVEITGGSQDQRHLARIHVIPARHQRPVVATHNLEADGVARFQLYPGKHQLIAVQGEFISRAIQIEVKGTEPLRQMLVLDGGGKLRITLSGESYESGTALISADGITSLGLPLVSVFAAKHPNNASLAADKTEVVVTVPPDEPLVLSVTLPGQKQRTIVVAPLNAFEERLIDLATAK